MNLSDDVNFDDIIAAKDDLSGADVKVSLIVCYNLGNLH
jgi:ATP-dependent 26S proteasome regulatory subunit